MSIRVRSFPQCATARLAHDEAYYGDLSCTCHHANNGPPLREEAPKVPTRTEGGTETTMTPNWSSSGDAPNQTGDNGGTADPSIQAPPSSHGTSRIEGGSGPPPTREDHRRASSPEVWHVSHVGSRLSLVLTQRAG